MLEELKKLNSIGGKDGLLFFMCDVIGHEQITIHDAEVICMLAPEKRNLSVSDIVSYCKAFEWVQLSDGKISVKDSYHTFLNDRERLNDTLVKSTVSRMFDENILNSGMFKYNSLQNCFLFRNDLLPLHFSVVRNMLISQGFMKRDEYGNNFHISPQYDGFIAKYCKDSRKRLTLENLKKQIESNEQAGEMAELFVLEYEKKRLGIPLCDQIKRVSEIDVAAGYDIVSFESKESQELDRFIEVKAASHTGFYWSRNEYEISKLKGKKYYLYLVELHRINQPGYSPQIIQNPAEKIMESPEWFVEAQTYYVKHI